MQVYSSNIGFHFIVIYKKYKNKLLIANPTDFEVTWTKISDYEKMFSNIVITSKPVKQEQLIINNSITIKKSLLLPKYLIFALSVIVSNCLLVITFFMAQVFTKILLIKLLLIII